jgi:hypothetical protein
MAAGLFFLWNMYKRGSRDGARGVGVRTDLRKKGETHSDLELAFCDMISKHMGAPLDSQRAGCTAMGRSLFLIRDGMGYIR